VFHRFIQRSLVEGFILDVADYRHVPDGPGVMLVGQDLDYNLTPSSFSVTLRRRGTSIEEQYREAVRVLLGAADQINEDGSLPTTFDFSSWTVTVADRKLGTRDEILAATLEALSPVAGDVFGKADVAPVENTDPRTLPQIAVAVPGAEGVLGKLGGNQAARQSKWDISARDLQKLRASGADFTLLDVREESEYETVNIGGKLVPLGELDAHLDELDKGAHIVAHCRAGFRGAEAVEKLRAAGFDNAWNLNGGIMAWVDYIDPSLPRY
jgi:adenylyltransferase/sulfurtransferase